MCGMSGPVTVSDQLCFVTCLLMVCGPQTVLEHQTIRLNGIAGP